MRERVEHNLSGERVILNERERERGKNEYIDRSNERERESRLCDCVCIHLREYMCVWR